MEIVFVTAISVIYLSKHHHYRRKRRGKGSRKNEDSHEDTDRDVEGYLNYYVVFNAFTAYMEDSLYLFVVIFLNKYHHYHHHHHYHHYHHHYHHYYHYHHHYHHHHHHHEGLWGADMTVIQSLPILWDLTGETCREIAKQTAGIRIYACIN
jgi:hypothetical protein